MNSDSAAVSMAEKEAEQPTTVLVVDDNRLIVATMSLELRAAGFATIAAHNGSDALRLAEQTPPSIAILDVNMPGLSGIDVAARWQREHSFPFIFLSANDDDAVVKRAVELGAMAYLLKPMDPPRLIPTIRACLRRFQDFRRLRDESAQLGSALRGARETSVVVGLLMERLQLSEADAYGHLRHYARSRNRKIVDVATEILSAAGQVNRTIAEIGTVAAKTRA